MHKTWRLKLPVMSVTKQLQLLLSKLSLNKISLKNKWPNKLVPRLLLPLWSRRPR
jgi:hypothetical protein